MTRVALIGCGSQKAPTYSLARDLYVSPLFKATLAHAEAGGFDAVYIVSAKHGLLQLEDAVAPYDFTLDEMTRDDRAWWAHLVMCQVQRWHEGAVELSVFAGAAYVEPLRWQLPEFAGWTITEPMSGLQVGERLHWLKERRLSA